MANDRRNRYSSEYDETDAGASSRRTRRSSQSTNSTHSSKFDTEAVTRRLEEDANYHVRQSRRNTSNYSDPAYHEKQSSTRRSSSASRKPVQQPVQNTYYETTAEERRERRRQRREAERWRMMHRVVRILIVIMLILDIVVLRFAVFRGGFLPVWNMITSGSSSSTTTTAAADSIDLEISEQLLTVNEYSRPGTALESINGIVIHYIGNAGTDAQANRDYFENLQDGSSGVYASCNYIIGLDGTIIQCVPDNEVAYASGDRNYDTISIECCHPDDTGEFTEETYNALVQLTAKLCSEYDLTTDEVIRHYDVNGKACPLYYVENEDAWTQFLSDVGAYL